MTLPVLPSIPRLPKSADLPSADLVPTTDQIDPHVADKTDDLGPAPDGLDTDVLHYPRIADLSKSLARAVAEFEPGMAGRIKDFVATTARAGLLMLLILVMACGQGPVPVGPDPVPAQPVIVPAAPAPVPATTPPKTQPAPVPSRLRLPTTWVEVGGQRVPVGPYLDQDTGRPCQLQAQADGSALCVPTDVVKIEAQTQTGYLDIDCTVPVARTQGAIEAWDGARVWRSLMGQPAIPDGTATLATRDQAGACKPARVIMAGGWAFTAGPTPAQLVYALVKRALD